MIVCTFLLQKHFDVDSADYFLSLQKKGKKKKKITAVSSELKKTLFPYLCILLHKLVYFAKVTSKEPDFF